MKPKRNLLTELYATFVVKSDGGTQYSFLFPWAEGGSMDHLLKKSPTRVIEHTATNPRLLLQWLAEQCYGLADGLRSIHDTRAEAIELAMEPSPALSPEVTRNLKELSKEVPKGQDNIDQDIFGIHGDLKPENILHFTQSQSQGPTGLGTLKIADFGLTQFFTRSRRSPLAIIPGVHLPALLTYSAPELMLKHEKYSRKADIWALGCIFSELISWVVLGREGVDKYCRARCDELNVDTSGHFKAQCWRNDSFFRVDFGPEIDSEPKTFLKTAVIKQHQMLKAELRRPGQSGSDILTDLLEFIEEKMLDTRRAERISCDDLVKGLGRFLKSQQESSPGDPYWDPPLPSFTTARRHNLEGAAMAVPSIFVDGPDQM
jgi:serine/threonine protein kinase